MAGGFNCPECDKVFTAKTSLIGHVKSVHRGERSVCGRCQGLFKDKSNLRRHIKACTRNAGIIRCAWHELGCNHASNRGDNVKRHMKSCTHRPGTWAGGVPKPIVVNQGGPEQNNKVLNNRTPQVNGLQAAVQENAQAGPSARAQGQLPQAMLQEAAALAEGPTDTPQMGVNTSEQGDPTDPVWFAANFPLFDGYWGQDMPQEEPTAAPQSPMVISNINGFQQVVVGDEWNAVHNTPFTTYGLGAGAFLPKVEPQGGDFTLF